MGDATVVATGRTYYQWEIQAIRGVYWPSVTGTMGQHLLLDVQMPGLYYEQAQVGKTIRHALRRTITEADNVFFCAMTHNPQPLHLD